MRQLQYPEVAEARIGLSRGQGSRAKDPASLAQSPLKTMPVETVALGASRNHHTLQDMQTQRHP